MEPAVVHEVDPICIVAEKRLTERDGHIQRHSEAKKKQL